MKKLLNVFLFALIALVTLGTTAYFAYTAHPVTIMVGPVPTIVYNEVSDLDIEENTLFHIGNYNLTTIQHLVKAAEKAHAKYYISAPYAEACSQPNATCNYGSYLAFHLEHSKAEQFWDIYCIDNKSDIICKPRN